MDTVRAGMKVSGIRIKENKTSQDDWGQVGALNVRSSVMGRQKWIHKRTCMYLHWRDEDHSCHESEVWPKQEVSSNLESLWLWTLWQNHALKQVNTSIFIADTPWKWYEETLNLTIPWRSSRLWMLKTVWVREWAISESVFLFLNFGLCYVSALEADPNSGAFCGRKGVDFGTG